MEAICGVQLEDIVKELMLMLGVKETIDQLAIALFVGMAMC